ncbi:MAG: hypothetical protein KUG78_06355 [Kangiellaceae bacterium]|nr:hypothetical protein [Kangiellaceae bacterium]
MKDELKHLYQAKSINYFEKQKHIETDEYVINIVDEITGKNCQSREKPDISGTNFGIEHTEVYPFKKGRKGDTYKKLEAENIISDSVREIKLDEFEITFVDFHLFLENLGIYKKSEFKENIVSSIEEKSKKFVNFDKFEKNGIWLEFPEYISFPNGSGSTSYFMQDEVYSSMISSPFDFFVYGNQKGYLVISKNKLIELKPFVNVEKDINLDLSCNPQTEFNPCVVRYKGKGKINATITAEINRDLYLIAEDVCSIHMSHIKVMIDGRDESDEKIYLYSDDVELEVKTWEKVDSNFIIKYSREGFSGEFVTDFTNKVESKFNSVFKKGDTIKVRTSQYDDNDRQKVFSGIKRFVIDKGNSIDIYITPSPYVELK